MNPVAMAKSHQHGALGLSDRLIAPQNLARYRASTVAFFNFGSIAGYSKPDTTTEMDLRLCEFVERAWEECDSRNIPADARLGLMHFIDALRGHLPGSQRLLLARSKNELPEQADPLPIIFLLAMVGAHSTKLRVALSLSLGFHDFCEAPKSSTSKLRTSPSHNGMGQYYSCCHCQSQDNDGTMSQKQQQSRTIGSCVCLGRSISKRISRFGTVSSPSDFQVASTLFETR